MFSRLVTRIQSLWLAAKTERASPKQIAWAVAVGVFAGCTPAVGFHGWVAVALATVLRLNRLFCWIGSRISNFLILPFIIAGEVQLAHRVRTGAWATFDREHAIDQAGGLLVDWIIGSVPVGIAFAVVFGFLAYALALRRQRRKLASAEA